MIFYYCDFSWYMKSKNVSQLTEAQLVNILNKQASVKVDAGVHSIRFFADMTYCMNGALAFRS
jgi:hypothetical protein